MTRNRIEVHDMLSMYTHQRGNEALDIDHLISSHVPTYRGLTNAIKSARAAHRAYMQTHGDGAEHKILIRFYDVEADPAWWDSVWTGQESGLITKSVVDEWVSIHFPKHSREREALNGTSRPENVLPRLLSGLIINSKTKCWTKPGRTNSSGYVVLGVGKIATLVHRLSYEMFIGPIPPGLDVEHTCDNKRCINPFHLEAVTRDENLHRSKHTQASKNSRKTHCKRGHPFDDANTYLAPDGYRRCRACQRERRRRKRDEE